MWLKLGAAAEGKTMVPWPVTVLVPPYGVSVYPGPDGFVTRLEVSKRMDESEALPSSTFTPDARVKVTYDVPESETYNDLLDLLQYIESLGFFWLGLRRVEWSEVKREWIPETPEEKSQLSMFSSRAEASFPETGQPFEPGAVREMVKSRESNRYLIIPMAFLRDGLNEYKRFRFVSAFYQFYFYLEDLYAQGKFKGRAVKDEFHGSTQLLEAAEEAVAVFSLPEHAENRRSLDRFLKERGHEFSGSGLLDLVVDMRGQLHHFSQRSSRTHGHPLNQHEFRALAWLLFNICMVSYKLIIRDGEPM